MAIVPQISSVQPNTEVRSVSRTIESPLGVNASLSDIQTFINETSLGGQTQITFQQGEYTANGDIEVPSNAYVIIMNGAFLPDVSFVDDQGDPSQNVVDLNILSSGEGGGEGVLFNIEADNTIAFGSSFSGLSPGAFQSGIVKAGVALDGEQNEVLLNNSSGSGDSRDFDSIEVDQNSILARTGSDLDSFTIPSNSLLVRENSNLTTFSFGSNKVLATNSSSELQDVSVSSNSAVIRGGSGGVKSESIGTDQFLANTGSGLEATDLDSVQNKLDISAEDVSSGTFKSTGSGVTYTFNSTLTVEEDVTVNASVSISGDVSADSMTVGRVTIPSDSSIIRPTSGNELTIESGSGPEDDTSSITFTKGDSKEGISLRSDDLIVDIDKNSVTSIKTINSKLSREDRFDFRTDYFKTVTGDMEYKNSANNFVDAYTDLNTGVLNEFLEHGVYVTSSGGIVLPVFKNAAIQDNVKGTTDTSIFNEGLKPPKGHATIVVQEDSGSLLLTVVKDDGTEDGV